jgi:hypothetical protein
MNSGPPEPFTNRKEVEKVQEQAEQEQAEQVRGLVVDPVRSWRAWYGWFDDDEDSGVRVEMWPVLGWACLGPDIWPMRVERDTGRGVLVGSVLDPDREALLGVLLPGEDWQALPGMDERIRDLVREGVSR